MSEAPHVKAAAAQYGDVAFVGVAGPDTEAAMKEFVQRTKTGNFPHLSDEKGAVWRKLGVSQQSMYMKPDGTTAKASEPLGKEQLDRYRRFLHSASTGRIADADMQVRQHAEFPAVQVVRLFGVQGELWVLLE
jgi:hypothetical protein